MGRNYSQSKAASFWVTLIGFEGLRREQHPDIFQLNVLTSFNIFIHNHSTSHCWRRATVATMLSRSALSHHSSRSLRQVQCTSKASQRGLAAAASGSFQYESGDSAGVKYASRDLPGATTTLAVVAKAGTRYQPLPGLSDGLEKFAFKVCDDIPEIPQILNECGNRLRRDELHCELLERRSF